MVGTQVRGQPRQCRDARGSTLLPRTIAESTGFGISFLPPISSGGPTARVSGELATRPIGLPGAHATFRRQSPDARRPVAVHHEAFSSATSKDNGSPKGS